MLHRISLGRIFGSVNIRAPSGVRVSRFTTPFDRQDAEGRYCLNDLHRAAGNEDRHAPALWLSNARTNALIAALSDENKKVGNPTFSPVATYRGRNGGTYAAKELVYDYASWIRPSFNIDVIRTFDAVVTGNLDALPPSAIAKLLESVITSPDVMNRLEQTNKP